jgi:hypothetical protein
MLGCNIALTRSHVSRFLCVRVRSSYHRLHRLHQTVFARFTFLKARHADARALMRAAHAGGFKPTLLGRVRARGRKPPAPEIARVRVPAAALKAVQAHLKACARAAEEAEEAEEARGGPNSGAAYMAR